MFSCEDDPIWVLIPTQTCLRDLKHLIIMSLGELGRKRLRYYAAEGSIANRLRQCMSRGEQRLLSHNLQPFRRWLPRYGHFAPGFDEMWGAIFAPDIGDVVAVFVNSNSPQPRTK
ncbi:hypothetical protein PIB30_038034 [Stylosanthes scabra]|uniref:Uncharacterized protein n=1 Tax=Stylosanthes scabra TaxID=79078 RepID=A0ABU6TE51_9FABA|nr:hypothetical protein [Stylosanthes scabra]